MGVYHCINWLCGVLQVQFDLELPRRSLLLEFTCNVCTARTQRMINPNALRRGTVYVQVRSSYLVKIVIRMLVGCCQTEVGSGLCDSAEGAKNIISWWTI